MRSFDGERLNYLVNHPTIRPHVGGDGKSFLDLAKCLADHNYFLKGDFGGFFCQWSAPQTYEIHTFILPEGRGEWAYEFARDGRAFMAEEGATHLWTRVPLADRHTRIFTLKAGFKRCGTQVLESPVGPQEYELFNWRTPCQQQ